MNTIVNRLNPCSNGMRGGGLWVLLLQEVCLCLNPCSNGMRGGQKHLPHFGDVVCVLILVLMECAAANYNIWKRHFTLPSLNPYSNGMRGARLIFSAITISDYSVANL